MLSCSLTCVNLSVGIYQYGFPDGMNSGRMMGEAICGGASGRVRV